MTAPRLLHLNGPAGAGKSTLARLHVDRHPGTLLLEADHVAAMIGGWRNDFAAAFASSRHLALAMAGAHLERGLDVVMPQLVTRVEEAARFEACAAAVGATYVEVALLVGPESQLERFAEKSGSSPVDRVIGDHIADRGGETVLRRIHGHLGAYLQQRPRAVLIDTDDLDAAATYDAVVSALP